MFGTTAIVLSIPLNADRPRFLDFDKSEDGAYTNEEPMIDIKNNYYLTSISYNDTLTRLKSRLSDFVGSEEGDISANVYHNSIKLLSKISPTVFNEFYEDGLYTTDNGTVIFDWEQSEDVFSLEIGKDALGYFVEKDGVDILQVDKLSLNEVEFEETSKKVLSDLSDFL